mgnify:CR=1 FL=1
MVSSPQISLKNITLSFGEEPIFDNLNLLIHPHDRVALVGRNGSGKSTLLKLLQGLVDDIDTLNAFSKSLENRARTMNNELIKIDMLVSAALDLRPDIERVARAENFVEDGNLDSRRD